MKFNLNIIKIFYILGLDDNTTMEEYFQNDNNPEIKVIDFDGMLLTKPIEKYSITFQTSQGNTETFEAFLGSKLERIISNYLTYIDILN